MILMLVALILAFHGPLLAQVGVERGVSIQRLELVGFSSAALTGDSGVHAMTKACQSDVPRSRMCTSQEIMESLSIPDDLAGSAWVRPVFASVGRGAPNSGAEGPVDASGAGAQPYELACSGWSRAGSSSQGSFRGLAVDPSGAFRTEPCSEPLQVACCAQPPGAEGDMNGDGFVDIVDVVLLRRFLAEL